MRTTRVGFPLIAAALLLLSGRAAAQSIAVSGSPGLLRISSALAGAEPTSVSNSSTTYTVTTPNPNRTFKVTARLNAAMPPGVTLTGTYDAPPGATSLGPITLDLTDRDVVTGIPRRTTATQAITYQLSTTVAAGVVPNSSRTVTLTIVETP